MGEVPRLLFVTSTMPAVMMRTPAASRQERTRGVFIPSIVTMSGVSIKRQVSGFEGRADGPRSIGPSADKAANAYAAENTPSPTAYPSAIELTPDMPTVTSPAAYRPSIGVPSSRTTWEMSSVTTPPSVMCAAHVRGEA